MLDTDFTTSSNWTEESLDAIRGGKNKIAKAANSLAKMGYTVTYNEMIQDLEVDGLLLDEKRFQGILKRANYWDNVSDKLLKSALYAAAEGRSYHPIKTYLESTEWDGHNYIGDLCFCLEAKKEDVDLNATLVGRWLIGAVAVIYNELGKIPYQNPMIVVGGPQGIGKSSLAEWLFSDVQRYYYTGPLDPKNKDHRLLFGTTWGMEISEAGASLRKAERDALKHMLTISAVRERRPYDKRPTVFPRTASLIGTFNDTAGILSDPTGNRRFWPLALTGINWAYSKNIKPVQIWAQAKAMFDGGYLATPLPNLHARYEEFAVEDTLPGLIVKHCSDLLALPFVPTVDLADRLRASDVPLMADHRAAGRQIAEAMLDLGWVKANKRVNGKRTRGWSAK
jgi:hypothetical protein